VLKKPSNSGPAGRNRRPSIFRGAQASALALSIGVLYFVLAATSLACWTKPEGVAVFSGLAAAYRPSSWLRSGQRAMPSFFGTMLLPPWQIAWAIEIY